MKKSDKSMPSMGHSMPAGKTNHPIAEASMGANEHPRKSHQADVELGEGLEYGAVHSAHTKHAVKVAKHVMGMPAASRGRQMAVENGSADKD